MPYLTDLNTPIFAAEGILHLNPETYVLHISGLNSKTKSYSLADLKTNFPKTTLSTRLTSVSGWSVRANWTGILWNDLITLLNPMPQTRYALFKSAGDYSTAVLLSDLYNSNSMLVWGIEEEPLEDSYGGPVRMIIPNLWGYKSCKWLTHIEFIEKYIPGYWELLGYSHRGTIESGETFDVNSGKYRKIKGGEVKSF